MSKRIAEYAKADEDLEHELQQQRLKLVVEAIYASANHIARAMAAAVGVRF